MKEWMDWVDAVYPVQGGLRFSMFLLGAGIYLVGVVVFSFVRGWREASARDRANGRES